MSETVRSYLTAADVRRFDKVEATFAPDRCDDLVPGAAACIGMRGVWQAAYEIDNGPYAGQWAMSWLGTSEAPFAWVPWTDIAFATRYTGPAPALLTPQDPADAADRLGRRMGV